MFATVVGCLLRFCGCGDHRIPDGRCIVVCRKFGSDRRKFWFDKITDESVCKAALTCSERLFTQLSNRLVDRLRLSDSMRRRMVRACPQALSRQTFARFIKASCYRWRVPEDAGRERPFKKMRSYLIDVRDFFEYTLAFSGHL